MPMADARRPSRSFLAECFREGRVARGGAVLTVEVDAARVEVRLAGGDLRCPLCGDSLRGWGWARKRSLRTRSEGMEFRPRRARCGRCRVSHVLLPVFALVRRADVVEVIGAALVAKARGAGARVIARELGRPVETVRGWLRVFGRRAEPLRVWFTRLLVEVGVDPIPPAAAGSVFADAVSAVLGAVWAARSRWPWLGVVSGWRLAVAASAGRLLAPSWPVGVGNTS